MFWKGKPILLLFCYNSLLQKKVMLSIKSHLFKNHIVGKGWLKIRQYNEESEAEKINNL